MSATKIVRTFTFFAGLSLLTTRVIGRSAVERPVGEGCLIKHVEPGTAAATIGLRSDDVIVEANLSTIRSADDLRAAVNASSGSLVLKVHRGNSTQEFTAPLPSDDAVRRLGVSCSELSVAPALSPEKVWITPKIGLSHFTGLIGVEVQKRHWALNVGYPASGGLRYYVREAGHSWFVGAYGAGYGTDRDETKDGVRYTHYSTIGTGTGGGYRWQWSSHWNCEVGATVGYQKEKWTNNSAWRWQKSIAFFPVVTVGRSF